MSQFFQGVTAGSLPPSVATKYTADDGNFAVPTSNNLNVFGDIGTSTFIPTPGGDTIKIRVDTVGYDWSEKNATFNADIENGYFCNSTLTANLPATAGLLIGNALIVYVDTTDVITIQANTGQFIQVGSNISIAGGMVTSNTRGAILELIFKPSDLTWHTMSSLGVWSVT